MNEETKYTIAVVGEVFQDGLSLIFPGEEEASEKHYKCNTSIYFQAGDRVKICEDSGSYIVEYVIGNPTAGPPSPSGGGVPEGGASGQVLAKTSATDYAVGWSTPHYIPSGGTDGQVLIKSGATNYSAVWGNPPGLPRGGTSGQVLTKTSATDYAASWSNPVFTSVRNYYNTTTQNSDTYNIYFKTDASYNPTKLYWRMGTSGTWKQLT